MLRASEMLKFVGRFKLAPLTPDTVETVGAGNWPVVIRPGVFAAPVEIKLTANWLAAVRSSSANLTRNRICFSTAPAAIARLLTTILANGADSAVARSETSFDETLPVND